MGISCSTGSSQKIYAPMETSRQSNGNVEKCSGASTETSSQSTNLCQLENTTESDENKITNELNPDKCVLYCTTCHLQLSGTNREHKLHIVETLKKAADDAKKRLEDVNQSEQLKSEQFRQSCVTKLKEHEDKGLTTEDLHRVVDSEFNRIGKALNDSLESIKEQRESQYKTYLQDLKKTKSSLEQNIETLKTKQRETEYIPDIDLLCKEDSLTKQLQKFQNSINIPSFDEAGELVENSFIRALYSKQENEKLKQKEKEHKRLQIEKEFFENAFETVMNLLKSLVNYKENKNATIQSSELPKIPDKSLRKKLKQRRTSANDALKGFKNIATELIDFERTKEEEQNDLERKKEQESDSDKERITEDVTYKSATGEIKEVTEIDEFKKVKVQKEKIKNVIKTIGRWINVCHTSVKQGEIDQDELTVPSEQLFGKTGMEKLEYIRRNLEDIRQHVKQLKEEISSTSKRLEEKGNEAKTANSEREQELESKKQLKEEIPSKQLEETEKETKTVKLEREQRIKELENKVSSTSKQLEEKKKETKAANSERDKALERIKELENEISSTSKQLEEKKKETNAANSERKEALESIKRLEKEISSASKQLEEKEKETQAVKLEREQSMEKLEREMSSISTQLEGKSKEAEVANLERNRALTRLSEVAGSRLRENNPMIADLSDDYRPTKLGEKFGEVYDNEWTDAYQSITKKLNLTEKEAIRLLLEFVKVIYETCTEIAQTQLNDMFSSIKVKQSAKETKVPGFLKKIKDFQKQITPEMMAVVAKAIKKKKFKNVKLEEGFKPCENYIHSCIQLCWMMNVQDPPVVLVFDEEIGADINTGLFRYYTKSGRSMDYMVWPAMLLHEGGALLQKGVVQPQ